MAGNVWEWTSSIYTEYPYRADDGREDRSLFQARAARGGTFSIYQDAARTTYRGINDPIGRNWYDGFRVGLTSSRAKETY
jgi:formylglycine-generating enzyme required for sulfatase activity